MSAPSDARCLCIAATGVAPDSADAALPAGLSPQPDRGSPPCHHNTVSHNTVTVYRRAVNQGSAGLGLDF